MSRRRKAIKAFEQKYRDANKIESGEYAKEKGEFYYDHKNKKVSLLPTDDADRPITTGVKKRNLGENFKSPLNDEVKKDACYHKVKARVKVWPSAYASGQLVQCRNKNK